MPGRKLLQQFCSCGIILALSTSCQGVPGDRDARRGAAEQPLAPAAGSAPAVAEPSSSAVAVTRAVRLAEEFAAESTGDISTERKFRDAFASTPCAEVKSLEVQCRVHMCRVEAHYPSDEVFGQCINFVHGAGGEEGARPVAGMNVMTAEREYRDDGTVYDLFYTKHPPHR